MRSRIRIAALVILLACSLSYGDDDEPKGPLMEAGLTLLLPAVLNIDVGYWGTADFPLLVRLSGMYYGGTRGIQADVGWAFDRRGSFKQFIAATFGSGRFSTTPDAVTTSVTSFTGAGPTYGLNWGGFSAQGGFLFGSTGQATTTHSAIVGLPTTTSTTSVPSPVGLTLQLGYTYLWEL